VSDEPTVDSALVADLKQQLAACGAELRQTRIERDEALRQQAASAEILEIISHSPGDLGPVFDAILERATRLGEAKFGIIYRFDGEVFRVQAVRDATPAFIDYLRREPPRPDPRNALGRALRVKGPIHIADTKAEPAYSEREPSRVAAVEIAGARTFLAVPMLRGDRLIGVIAVYRQRVEPFTPRQVELVQIFADQAVIAVENARLINETREALEKQTATAGILRVISRSPTNVQPTFEAIAESAARICDAANGSVFTFDGSLIDIGAIWGYQPGDVDALRSVFPIPPGPGSASARAILTREPVHILDPAADPEYAYAALFRFGTLLAIPMLRDGKPLGAIVVTRNRIERFSDSQIDLLKTFADQAVIAIETVRLFNELHARTHDLQESLEYQTAISDVLKVISRSTFDLQPVLNTLVETAARLCRADRAGIAIREGDVYRIVATVGGMPEYDAIAKQKIYTMDRSTLTGRVALERRVLHIDDITADPDYAMPETVSIGRMRTGLGVPLLREGESTGVIALWREHVQPFTERQIELVSTFADQAVIAIENTRLLGELRESLEQQTATTEVLQAINASPGDLKPVFDAILEKAHRLCGATSGLLVTKEGEYFRTVATHAVLEGEAELLQRPFQAVMPNSPYSLLSAGERVVHIPDLVADTWWDRNDPRRASAIEHGLRALLFIPLRKDNTLIGYISANRHEMRPFSDKETKLLEGFAAQAVIAMENARLLGELRQRTADLARSVEELTATSDVLKIISRSTFDLQPILDTLVETVVRLCRADQAGMYRLRDNGCHIIASHGLSEEAQEFQRTHPLPADRGSMSGRVALERRTVHIPDVWQDPEYTYREGQKITGFRTLLGVPLLRGETLSGTLVVARSRGEPFSDKEIELITSFADQAVIAMENARLIAETQEALDRQTATAEVLQVINTSQGDLKPVFDAILDKALRLSHSAFGTLRTFDGTRFQLAAEKNVPQAYLDFSAQRITNLVGVHALGPPVACVITEKRVLQIVDTMEDDDRYRSGDPTRRAIVDLAGARTMLFVPLINDDVARGLIMVFRTEVRAYSEKEIALLQNFAAQAAIAMDNARLLGELRERQAELRVTFDNMGDGVALFDAEPRLVAWNRNFQNILDLPDALLTQRLTYVEYIRMLAERGEFGTLDNIEQELDRRLGDLDRPALFSRTRPDGKVIEARRNPVPGGGFVLIYSDITERKRAEAEISAARDAAEKALRELQAAQASLLHSQKMAALGQLTAGIAHEIKNPLNFVNNFADLSVELLDELKAVAAPLLSGASDRAEIDDTMEMLTSNLAKIAEHGRRADGIVRSMLAHSRGGGGDRQVVDLNALIEESLNLAYHGARAQDQNFNITLERDFDPTIKPIELVPQDITRVFLNLFGNGFYAANKRARAYADGNFRPVLRVATHDAGDAVEIRVRDNGAGIPSEMRDKLFQPFFTTKPTGEGTGLGLSISYDIVTQQHGGAIAVDSEEGVFTEFMVWLPRGGRALQAKGLS
jgi:GAF domain-containing protein/nitrogen-specific signal transduction histidine kinase